MFLYGKKSFILKFFFTEKNFFYIEKYKWKCKKYITFQIYIFTQKIFVLQIKHKSFIFLFHFHLFILQKKKFFWS